MGDQRFETNSKKKHRWVGNRKKEIQVGGETGRQLVGQVNKKQEGPWEEKTKIGTTMGGGMGDV